MFEDIFYPSLWKHILTEMLKSLLFNTIGSLHNLVCNIQKVQGKYHFIEKLLLCKPKYYHFGPAKLVFSGCIPVSRYFSGAMATSSAFSLHMSHKGEHFLLFFHSFFEIHPRGKTDC